MPRVSVARVVFRRYEESKFDRDRKRVSDAFFSTLRVHARVERERGALSLKAAPMLFPFAPCSGKSGALLGLETYPV